MSETFDNALAGQLAADRGDTEVAMMVDVEAARKVFAQMVEGKLPSQRMTGS